METNEPLIKRLRICHISSWLISAILLLVLLIPSIGLGESYPTIGDVYWLTQNIYHESRGESIKGQRMVAVVTLNRLNSGRWGNTMKEVVTAYKQFSWHSDGKPDFPWDEKSWKLARRIAISSIALYSKLDNSQIMYYHSVYVFPKWSKKLVLVRVIGRHWFYKS